MSAYSNRRFFDIDLGRLPPVPSIETLDYEAIHAASRADLAGRLNAANLPYDVALLDSDPAIIVDQARSYRELLMRGRVNDAIRDVLLPSARGGSLDSLAWPFGVTRLLLTPGVPAASPPIAPVFEDDDSFRRRIQLAWEAASTAGPAGAYEFFARAASAEVADAIAYGPEVAGILPGEAHLIVLARSGTGLTPRSVLLAIAAAVQAYAIEEQGAVREIVWEANRRQSQAVRPLTDMPIVRAAAIITYAVEARIVVEPGPDQASVLARARSRVAAFTQARRAIGRAVDRDGLRAALFVLDEQGRPAVRSVALAHPAVTLEPGLFGACHCTSIAISMDTAGG